MTYTAVLNTEIKIHIIRILISILPKIELNLSIGEYDINAVDERGLTPLMWSSAYGQVPTAALLLRAGGSHSIKGPDGETAMHLAAAGGHTDIIRLLIAAGAAVNEVDDVI